MWWRGKSCFGSSAAYCSPVIKSPLHQYFLLACGSLPQESLRRASYPDCTPALTPSAGLIAFLPSCGRGSFSLRRASYPDCTPALTPSAGLIAFLPCFGRGSILLSSYSGSLPQELDLSLFQKYCLDGVWHLNPLTLKRLLNLHKTFILCL